MVSAAKDALPAASTSTDGSSLTLIAERTGPARSAGTGSVDVIAGAAVETQTLLLTVQPIEALWTR